MKAGRLACPRDWRQRVRRGGLIFLLLFAPQSFSQTTPFSQENATAILKTLAVEIGPRPMGSPNEQRAMHFAVSKFNEYGCDTSFIMPMMVAERVNTKSGVAIGVKKGNTQRIIVIGGHIDTSGPDIPGANDDGSGTACVIELARVLAKRATESTIYFCCWGGEEVGLRGSEYFVKNFRQLDSVALMLQLDMADGAGVLHADPDGSKTSAPSWLVESAFDIFYNNLPHDGLTYPTEAATWNLAVGGAFGSDHIPFLDKGIPAIDFTSDPTFPIHTPQDSWENFTPSGLQRTGDLVLKLVEMYDSGVPSRTTEHYQLLQLGRHVFFVPYSILWTFIGIGLISLLVAFIVARRRRLHLDPMTKVKWSRLKLIVAALVLQTFIWSAETLLGFIKGYRFPWVNNLAGFTILGMLFGLVGLWFVLQAVRRYRLSADADLFTRFSVVAFLLLTVAASYVTPELGMFLAAASLSFAVAVIGRKPKFKLLFFLFSFLIVYKLVFFEGLALFQRLQSSNMLQHVWQKGLLHLAFILIFTALSLPFVYGFAAIYRGSGFDLFWLKTFRGRAGLIASSVGVIGVAVYLLAQPVYGKLWYSNIRVEQTHTLGVDSMTMMIRSSEALDGVRGSINGRDTSFAGRGNYAALPLSKQKVEWTTVVSKTTPPLQLSDSTLSVERRVHIASQFRPLRIDAYYESEQPFDIASPWAHGPKMPDPSQRENERRKHFQWMYFPDSLLDVPVTFTVRDSQQVNERIEIVFDSAAYPIRLHRAFTNVSYRTVVTARDSFSVTSQ
jgi:hypothetical protein